jgi:hypothetical protein
MSRAGMNASGEEMAGVDRRRGKERSWVNKEDPRSRNNARRIGQRAENKGVSRTFFQSGFYPRYLIGTLGFYE